MSAERDRAATAATTTAVLLVCVAGWVVAAGSGLLATSSKILIWLLANLVLTFDVIDLLARIWLKRLHGASGPGPSIDLGLPEISNAERLLALQPYALIASVHDETLDIDRFLATLRPFKDVVWLIDDGSTDRTLLRLRCEGWRCLAGTVNQRKPGALRQLLKALPADVQSVVVMDPDVRWVTPAGQERATLEQVITDFQRSAAAALTPRVQARPGGWLVECQALEYELACGLGRKSLRDVCCNSGVSVYRRSALDAVLERHSLSVYAEDFENSVLLLQAGERIYYDDRFIIETRAKDRWGGLFAQRVGWAFGGVRLVMECFPQLLAVGRRSPLAAYQYLIYFLGNGILLLPLKLAAAAVLVTSFLRSLDTLLMTHLVAAHAWNEPLLFALWYCKSTLVLSCACFAALPRGERARHLATLPFYALYALLQLLPVTVGYLNLLTLKLFGRRLYNDHYDAWPLLGRTAAPFAVMQS